MVFSKFYSLCFLHFLQWSHKQVEIAHDVEIHVYMHLLQDKI